MILTNLPVLWHITATVVQLPQAAVPCQGVHDPCCTDGVDERRFSGSFKREETWDMKMRVDKVSYGEKHLWNSVRVEHQAAKSGRDLSDHHLI